MGNAVMGQFTIFNLKLAHQCGFPAIYACKAALVLEFMQFVLGI